MKWRLPVALAIAACGMWMAGRAVSITNEMGEKVERFKDEVQRQVAAHAARSGERGKLPEDNSSCLVCHLNLDEELIAATHLKVGVTCAHCHGLSYEHADDEGHETRPDVLFGRAEVAPFCERCHGPHENPQKVAAFLADNEGKPGPSGQVLQGPAVCTHCHGTHARPGRAPGAEAR